MSGLEYRIERRFILGTFKQSDIGSHSHSGYIISIYFNHVQPQNKSSTSIVSDQEPKMVNENSDLAYFQASSTSVSQISCQHLDLALKVIGQCSFFFQYASEFSSQA